MTMTVASAISQNKTKTGIIMLLFVVFVATVGFIYGKAIGNGTGYALFAFAFAVLSSFASFFWSDKLVLATSGAKQIQRKDSPQLFSIIESLASKDSVPTPKVYLINDQAPNAFATGRDYNHASVAVTTGILDKLTKDELEGVLAHELSHVKNYDIRLMGVVAVLVGFVAMLGNLFTNSLLFGGLRSRDDRDNSANLFIIVAFVFAILSPIIATLIQLAISRKRELLADASGVLLTRYPKGLADALDKIAKDQHILKSANTATAHFYIENPFKGKNSGIFFASLFNTHPPIEERIKILRSM